MPFLTINQRPFFYTHTQQSAAGPALLLLHGAGGSHLDWPAELRRMPDTAVYALDLPGHGRSAGPSRTAVSAYAGDVQAFMAALDLQNVVLVGHSMGGAIAMTIALRHEPRLAGLVLVGTGARLRVSPALLDALQTDADTAVSLIIQYAWGPDAPPQLVALGLERLRETDPQVVYGDFSACDAFDVMDQLAQIQAPTLVISATEDKMTPVKYGRYLAGHIPGAQLVIIEGAGHFIAQEQPQAVVAAITDFLATKIAP